MYFLSDGICKCADRWSTNILCWIDITWTIATIDYSNKIMSDNQENDKEVSTDQSTVE